MRLLKKYSSGQGSHYISRTQALAKLQLSLKDFRRLCILKGIYPREPNKRRVAQKGSTEIKILYHSKDIRFLLHEPIVWNLRDYKIFNRRVGRDRAVRDFRNMRRRIENSPNIKMDHVVKERYPTFIDAVKDLDDCLSLLFLFSTFPSLKFVARHQSDLCRRLTIEFMHAVIASKALRKVFISIKGYYFQADIKGQMVTWIIPHYYPFSPQKKADVDFKVMSIFVEFYTIMLGFVNYRLYQSFNVQYPPQFNELTEKETEANFLDENSFVSERIAALNVDLIKTDASLAVDDDEDMDLELLTTDGDSAKLVKMKEQMRSVQKLKSLFKGLRFFINREVPREPLVFIIRCFGGQVSWDKTLFVGSTFNESDETITHQIVDRPNIGKRYISRDYVQPQWIFDCVNQIKLLETNKYFIGVDLPPHLSPFVDPERETYVPPEERALHDPTFIESNYADEEENDDIEEDMTEPQMDEELEKAFREEAEELGENDTDNDDNDEDGKIKKAKIAKQKKKKMEVKSGELYKENAVLNKIQELQTDKLQTRMVKNRHRRLYRKLVRDKKIKDHETNLLSMKRREIDNAEKTRKTILKKSEHKLADSSKTIMKSKKVNKKSVNKKAVK